jgi:hypothetical protein
MFTAIRSLSLNAAAVFNPHLGCLAPLAMMFTLQSAQPRIIPPDVLSVTARINVEWFVNSVRR